VTRSFELAARARRRVGAAAGLALILGVMVSSGGAQRGPAAGPPTCDPDNGGMTLPDGFCAVVVADGLGAARHLAVAPNGDIYVAIRNRPDAKGGLVALRDTNGDGRADRQERFGDDGGTGIAVRNGYLYFGRDTAVVRYRLDGADLVPAGSAEMVVDGFPVQRDHAAKPIVFDHAGYMYVNVGAPSNACMEKTRTPESPGRKPCPELERHGAMWRFKEGATGQTQQDGQRYGTGIRHAVAIAWHPAANALYAVAHGRDQLDSLWPKLFTAEQNAELPSEEFVRVDQDSDYGWPYCYHDPQQNRRVLGPEYGGDGKKTDGCEKYPNPLLAFPAHWAPNDLLFYTGEQFPQTYRNGAFIAFHGSWNRAPLQQRGYKIVFVPMEGGKPAGKWDIFADNFTGQESIARPQDARFRPMGVAQGPDGSLYISDSVQGRIWRVIYSGS
jgi:glucose/arabinose dehydrogenase